MSNAATTGIAISRAVDPTGAGLVGVVTPLVDVALQLKAGYIKPSVDLQRSIDAVCKTVDELGVAAGFKTWQVQLAKFAAIALIDETVLATDFPQRQHWEKAPLQLKLFGEHMAGVRFFERLSELEKEFDRHVDIIEVYYLCLVLGFKGKYKILFEDQLKATIQSLAERLRRANRLRDDALSPNLQINDQPPVVENEPLLPMWAKVGGVAMTGLVVAVYLVLSVLLNFTLNGAKEQLMR